MQRGSGLGSGESPHTFAPPRYNDTTQPEIKSHIVSRRWPIFFFLRKTKHKIRFIHNSLHLEHMYLMMQPVKKRGIVHGLTLLSPRLATNTASLTHTAEIAVVPSFHTGLLSNTEHREFDYQE